MNFFLVFYTINLHADKEKSSESVAGIFAGWPVTYYILWCSFRPLAMMLFEI